MHRAACGRVDQGEQPARLVVGELEPPGAVEDEQSLAHRVQHRVPGLVESRDLDGPEAVGLPAEAAADRVRAGRREHQREGGVERGLPDLPRRSGADAVHGEPDRDETEQVTVADDRRYGAHRRAERAGVGLGERGALERGPDGADVVAPDHRRVRVAEADPARGHHHDEVRAGRRADLLGVGLDRRAMLQVLPRVAQGLGDRGVAGDGGCDGLHHARGPPGRVAPRVEDRRARGEDADHQDDRGLEQEELACE